MPSKSVSKKTATTKSVKKQPNSKSTLLPKFIISFLIDQSKFGDLGVAVDLQYEYKRSNVRVRVRFREIDEADLSQLEQLGHVPHAVVMIRARPGEAHFAKRERYVIFIDAPHWWSTTYDMRQDVIDAIKKHWGPATDWSEEYPEGLSLMVSAVQIPAPLYFVPAQVAEPPPKK